MNWNIFLLCASIFMLLFSVGAGFTEHLMEAEAIAERLAPLIGIKEALSTCDLRAASRSEAGSP